THTAYCFSANCKTHGRAIDVIDFIMHKENISKHEAIEKAASLSGDIQPGIKTETAQPPECLNRPQFLGNMFQYFRNAISNSQPAKDYVKNRSLDMTKIE